LVACVVVDDDNTIKDLKSKTFTLDTGVAGSVASTTWKGASRGYFVTTANGEFNFNGLRWSATQPQVDETDADGIAVWFACAGASAPGTPGDPSPFLCIGGGGASPRGLMRVPGANTARYISGGGTVANSATSLPTDGATKFSFGANYRSNVSSEVFYGLESGSLASDGTAGPDGAYGSSTATLWNIGGAVGYGNQPHRPFIHCVFNGLLTLAEFQSLHDNWVSALFNASGPTLHQIERGRSMARGILRGV
jgi:hypothetical protein